jgi:hypothetical protein
MTINLREKSSMHQADDHPLIRFIYQTFGSRFADLIMIGYGEEPSPEKKVFNITEEIAGRSVEWRIEATSNSLPSRQEPLILAALLNILLKRTVISPQLEFGMDELLDVIGGDNILLKDSEIDRIISNYVRLSFYKEPRNKKTDSTGLKWGEYFLIKGYFRKSIRNPGESIPERTVRWLEIEPSFVEGIKMAKVFFADATFGQMHLGDGPFL